MGLRLTITDDPRRPDDQPFMDELQAILAMNLDDLRAVLHWFRDTR